MNQETKDNKFFEDVKRLNFYGKLTQVEILHLKFFCEAYADEKIALMFNQESHRNEGVIKVRGEKGVGFIKKEDLSN